MASQLFQNYLFTDAGAAIVGATVDLLDRNTTTPVRATTTTDANGLWTISHATEGRFDVRITNGSSIRWHKYDAQSQIDTLEVANFNIRNPADTFDYAITPGAITADRQLNLPLITGTDTLAVLGLAQTFTAAKTFNDSVALTFGTGGDATIQYDGTNQLYNSLVVGTGYHGFTGDVAVLNGYGLIVGHTAQVAVDSTFEFQVLGTAVADSGSLNAIFNASSGLQLVYARSANATIGSHTILADDAEVALHRYYASDGANWFELARIRVGVDDATPAAGDIGGDLSIALAGGGGVALRTVFVIGASGNISFGALTPTLAVTGTRIAQSYHTNITSTNAVTVDSSIVSKVPDSIERFTNGLAIIDDIEIISFAHRPELDASGRIKVGVLAESIHEPMLLQKVASPWGGEYDGVDVMGLTALNTLGIQELHRRLKELEGTK